MRQLQATLTRIFIVLVSESHGFFGQNRKFERFFGPKTGDLHEKKKKAFTEIETNFSAKIGNSNGFSAQKQVISKKKKSSPKLRRIFRPNSEIQTVFQAESRQLRHSFGTQILLGGAVFIFSAKIGFKSTKNVQFCILYRPMGGLEPPLATLLMQSLLCALHSMPQSAGLSKVLPSSAKSFKKFNQNMQVLKRNIHKQR